MAEIDYDLRLNLENYKEFSEKIDKYTLNHIILNLSFWL